MKRHFFIVIWIAAIFPVGLASCSKSPDEVPALQNEPLKNGPLTTTGNESFLWRADVKVNEALAWVEKQNEKIEYERTAQCHYQKSYTNNLEILACEGLGSAD